MTEQQFNDAYPICSKFKYFPTLGKPAFELVETRSEAWTMCGDVIVKITGRAGGVSIENLKAC